MDDPQKKIYLVNNNEICKSYGDRVYHINVIIEYIVKGNNQYRRFCLILYRNGIKRIEKIL